MIKEEKSFFHLVTSVLCHDQEKNKFFLFSHYVHNIDQERFFFFHLVTTFTTPWSREFFFFFISALHSPRHGHKKNKLIFIAPLLWLRYDHKKYLFLISLRRSLCKYLLTYHYVPNENVSKRHPPQKNMCNLKSFFLRNFSGVLHDLLPISSVEKFMWHGILLWTDISKTNNEFMIWGSYL